MARVAAAGCPDPIAEYPFTPSRRWRFDFAWPDYKIALEIDGGVWVHGRHNRGSGYENDIEKYNAAAILGWAVLRATGATVRSGRAVADVLAMIKAQGGQKDAK